MEKRKELNECETLLDILNNVEPVLPNIPMVMYSLTFPSTDKFASQVLVLKPQTEREPNESQE